MNRALAVAQAVKDNIGSGTAAGTRVYLARLRPLTEDRRPLPDPTAAKTWINVVPGPVATPGDEGQTLIQHIEWESTLYVDLYVRSREADWLAAAMGLWAEVHALLMADYTQGLAYVVDTDPLGMDDPEADASSDLVAVAVRTTWRVQFRTSVGDLES